MASLVIIGSGLGAYLLAKEWRKYDSVSSLTIVTRSMGHYYSKPQLSTALAKGQSADALVMQSAEAMEAQLSATVITETEVTAVDTQRQYIYFGDQSLEYSQLVLAVGAEPIALNLTGAASDGVVSVNQWEDYRRFRYWLEGKKHIAILGSGLVGCEFMNDLLLGGRQVSVVSTDSTPLARLLPAALGEEFRRVMHEMGVNWYFGAGATALQQEKTATIVKLRDGRCIQADGVLSAVGLRANVSLAKQAGLRVNQGIVVDGCMRTSHPNVFALGDCAEIEGRLWQYVAPLLQSARALAKTLAGESTKVSYPLMPIMIKTTRCPLVVLPPVQSEEGRWYLEGKGADWVARFCNGASQLRGFALMGDGLKERAALLKEMSA